MSLLDTILPSDPTFAPSKWRADAARLFAAAIHMDTSTAMFAQQLEHLMAEDYDQKFPGVKWREFVPAASGIPAGAETVLQRGYSYAGHSTILAGDGFDVRRVTVDALEQRTRVVSLAVKWAITLQQLRAAAMANVPLDAKGMMAARRILEVDTDAIISLGDASLGLIGFVNQVTKAWGAVGAGVVLCAVGAPVGFTATWDTAATAAQILADVAIMVGFYRAGNVWEPTDLVLGSQTFTRLESLVALAGSPQTVLEVIRSRFGLKVSSWYRLDTASTTTGERAVMYARDKSVVEAIVPVETEILQPLWTGLGFETVSHTRCGGIQAADTNGIIYADM